MRALQERKDNYLQEVLTFLDRLKNYMDSAFGAAYLDLQDSLQRRSMSKDSRGLDVTDHDQARRGLWRYSPLMLFARDVDLGVWNDLVQLYAERARPVYLAEFKDNMTSWRKTARKPTKEEQAAVFTAMEKEHESLTSAAVKSTVKRSQTLARGFRANTLTTKKNAMDKNEENKLYPFEAFAGALEEMLPVVLTEQNFVIDFFHAYS